jgi:hypothetical protein
MNPADYATHGFRSGGVVDHLDRVGETPIALAFCRVQGGWKDDEMPLQYNGKRTAELQGRRSLKIAAAGGVVKSFDISKFAWYKERQRDKRKRSKPTIIRSKPTIIKEFGRRGGFFRIAK